MESVTEALISIIPLMGISLAITFAIVAHEVVTERTRNRRWYRRQVLEWQRTAGEGRR